MARAFQFQLNCRPLLNYGIVVACVVLAPNSLPTLDKLIESLLLVDKESLCYPSPTNREKAWHWGGKIRLKFSPCSV